jgi:hypothetical protein
MLEIYISRRYKVNPAFSSFRDLMDKCDRASKILLESDLCMFFKKDGVVYGAAESGRITFARMKNPESDDDLVWRKDASMVLYNLEKNPDENKVVVGFHDASDLKPISRDKAKSLLKKKGKDLPSVDDGDDEDEYFGEE